MQRQIPRKLSRLIANSQIKANKWDQHKLKCCPHIASNFVFPQQSNNPISVIGATFLFLFLFLISKLPQILQEKIVEYEDSSTQIAKILQNP